jgi:L-glyceraldehyde 3-phosphate reductase
VAFSPLAQGLLTDRYQHGIPAGSRASGGSAFLSQQSVLSNAELVNRHATAAAELGITLQEYALAWVLRGEIASAVVGVSSVRQLEQLAGAAALASELPP